MAVRIVSTMRVILGALALLLVPSALAASIPAPLLFPEPSFPPPVGHAPATGRLVLVESRYRDPGGIRPDRPASPAWIPTRYRGAELELSIRHGDKVFAVYGGRYVVGARGGSIRYAYDLVRFTRAPGGGWSQPVTWARETAGVLYVSTSHLTYASATRGRNGYVSAIDLQRGKLLWRSPALVANARTFVVDGDLIVTGYGFTAERDYLYLLDRHSGAVLDRLAVPSAPEVVKLRGDRLHVRTYDRQLVVRLRR